AAEVKSIALIGPFAEKAVTGGGGSSHVVPLYTINPPQGIRNVASVAKVEVDDGSDIAKATALARASDVALVMVGMVDTEGRDHSLTLGDAQNKLVEAVAAANRRTIVVLKTGSSVLMPWVDKVPAILEAWYPGEEDGNAVADVLFGKVNPSGRLPITFPRALEDVPASTPAQYPGEDGTAHYSEGVFVGYRHYDAKNITPLFAFGFGLSYTNFEYSNLRISRKEIALSKPETVTVAVTVKNTGKIAGAEVAQLYLGLPGNQIPEPPRQLKGFQKVVLRPGEAQRVRFQIKSRDLSFWDVKNHQWKISPGEVSVMLGSSSRQIRLSGKLRVGE
ncbi:MAG TPA: glycoside hydrolase family 3 C-terminal domain-containing protein, partial [Terriglobales bacterium]|nr:glycoside hydrolase family 3 C-terminal domain-containing protein [Terriglobales bacterium]